MSRILYCSDLALRIEDPNEDLSNITEWILTTTEFKPAYPEGCVLRQEVGTLGKLSVILIVWIALIVLTTFYCYFCEQRLFPKQRFLDWKEGTAYRKGRRGIASLFFRHREAAETFSKWTSPGLTRRRASLPKTTSPPLLQPPPLQPRAPPGYEAVGQYNQLYPSHVTTQVVDAPVDVPEISFGRRGAGELKFREFRRLEASPSVKRKFRQGHNFLRGCDHRYYPRNVSSESTERLTEQ